MKKKFELKGHWFLPERKSKVQVFGVLTSDGKRITLEAFGNFDGDIFTRGLKDETIIQGILSDSKKMTLYGCYMTHSAGVTLIQGEESGVKPNTYLIQYVFEGALIDKPEQLKFQKLVCTIHNLDEWVGISGFFEKKRKSVEFFNREKGTIDIDYSLPNQISFKINEHYDCLFNFTVNTPTISRYQKGVEMEQEVQLVILSKKDTDFEDLIDVINKFQNFLTLALYSDTTFKEISLYSDSFTADNGSGGKYRKRIDLFFISGNEAYEEKLKLDLEMLFTYNNIKDDFSEIIKNWFKKYGELEAAFNLLFEQFYHKGHFNENNFLNLAQAAETLHAQLHKDKTRMPKNEYNEMKKAIREKTPKEYHSWLDQQFAFGNHLTLDMRLTDLVNDYSNKILDKIISDKELFVKQVKWSRNYYTHYSSSLKKNALKGSELFYLAEKLKLLLVCAFLIEVGFSKKLIEEKLDWVKWRLFNHLANWRE